MVKVFKLQISVSLIKLKVLEAKDRPVGVKDLIMVQIMAVIKFIC